MRDFDGSLIHIDTDLTTVPTSALLHIAIWLSTGQVPFGEYQDATRSEQQDFRLRLQTEIDLRIPARTK